MENTLTFDKLIKQCRDLIDKFPQPEPEIKFVESRILTEERRSPNKTHRKKRIAKKYLKKYGEKVEIIPQESGYLIDTSQFFSYLSPSYKTPGNRMLIYHPGSKLGINLKNKIWEV